MSDKLKRSTAKLDSMVLEKMDEKVMTSLTQSNVMLAGARKRKSAQKPYPEDPPSQLGNLGIARRRPRRDSVCCLSTFTLPLIASNDSTATVSAIAATVFAIAAAVLAALALPLLPRWHALRHDGRGSKSRVGLNKEV
ncbi:hypothetical protein M438DRAFT_335326 [Aureobasidium pullulans EXF-150]|uniref:Uncharacterized protein n=1 Tax=Aureobasidium pullulans EXF-150 TaxID=1043002 RepID=A0A074XLH4_AURPU|nr:uncharacterized protein M438DRAFT_335326 [Aureobasidium pullulans EXF-150]KEQ84554.1 hypothetical protein M438DRAFT_335326 [Aureobasidium pullulans EXF-150]